MRKTAPILAKRILPNTQNRNLPLCPTKRIPSCSTERSSSSKHIGWNIANTPNFRDIPGWTMLKTHTQGFPDHAASSDSDAATLNFKFSYNWKNPGGAVYRTKAAVLLTNNEWRWRCVAGEECSREKKVLRIKRSCQAFAKKVCFC